MAKRIRRWDDDYEESPKSRARTRKRFTRRRRPANDLREIVDDLEIVGAEPHEVDDVLRAVRVRM